MIDLHLVCIGDLYSIKILACLNKCRQGFPQLGHAFRDGSLPNKGVFIGERFDLCSVDKDVMSGYFTQFEKQVAEFSHDFFCTDAEMNGDESGDRKF